MSLPILLIGAAFLVLLWVLRARISNRARKHIMVDGSNVMHWKDGEPDIDTVTEVVRVLTKKGYYPGVMFDANAGYKLTGRYAHDAFLARSIGLPTNRVMVVPKGTPADPYLLKAARDFGGQVVTNDRFRDWEDEFPEIRNAGFLVTGGFSKGKLTLNFAAR